MHDGLLGSIADTRSARRPFMDIEQSVQQVVLEGRIAGQKLMALAKEDRVRKSKWWYGSEAGA